MAKERNLRKKVLYGLITASILSISNNPYVWAANGDYAGQGKVITDESLADYSGKKVIGGWDIYSGNETNEGTSSTSTSINITTGKFDDTIGGSHIKQPTKDYNGKEYNISIGNTSINIDGGNFLGTVIGGSKANNSDNTILTVGNVNMNITGGAFNSAIIGGSNLKATGNPGGGTPAQSTSNTGDITVNISGGTFESAVYGGSVADNYGSVQTGGKPILTATDKSTNLTITGGDFNKQDIYAGGAAIGENSQYETSKANVTVKDANIDANIYGGAYAANKGIATIGEANVNINNSTINGNVYAGGKVADKNSSSTVDIANVNIDNSIINGNVIGGGSDTTSPDTLNFKINDSTINGLVFLDGNQSLEAKNIKVTDAINYNGSSYYKGIALNDGTTANFTGDRTDIIIDSESTGSVVGVQVFNGNATFSAKDTNIDVKAIGSSGKWGFGLLVNGTSGSKVIFNGENVNISNYNRDYTSQTLTAKSGSSIDFNNSGSVKVTSESPFGVTVVDAYGDITFNNGGNVDIIGTILPGDKTGQTNVVGIQSGVKGTKINVTDKVKDFNIKLSGAGVDNDGTSYSSGTNAVYLWDDIEANINSKTFNIDMQIATDVTDDAPGSHTSEKAYGLNPDGGTINIGENTVTSITINEGLGTAYGVYTNDGSVVNILGDTTINVTGKDNSYALYADGTNGGKINIGNGKSNIAIKGDILAEDQGEINLNGSIIFDGDKTKFITRKNNTDTMGTINLAGGNMSGVLNITEGSRVNLNGATFTTNDIAKDITGGGKLVLKDKGILVTTADQIFKDGNTLGVGKDNSISDTTKNKVSLESGTVNLTDEEYTLDFVDSAVETMKNYKYDDENNSNTNIVMSGDLVGETTKNEITVDTAVSIGADIALDKVTANAGKNLLVGKVVNEEDNHTVDNIEIKDSVANGFNVGRLNLEKDSTGIVITNNENVTLGGSQGGNIITVNGNEPDKATFKVVVGLGNGNDIDGVTNKQGSFTIGNALATDNTAYTLNGSIVVNDNSKLTTNGQTEINGDVTLNNGSINVESGSLQTESVNIASGTNNTITGTVNIGELKGKAETTLNIGTEDKTASTSIKNANLNGATICFDPAWDQSAGTHGMVFNNDGNTNIDGIVNIARNNFVAIGAEDSQAAKNMFAKTGLKFGENDITAALYIVGNQTLEANKGAIAIDGSKTGEDIFGTTAGSFNAAANSVTMVDGQKINGDKAALSGVSSVSVGENAKLYIDEAKKGETYKILSGSKISYSDNVWENNNIISNNALLKFEGTKTDTNYDVTASYDKVDNIYGAGNVVINDVIDNTLANKDEGNKAYDFFNKAVNNKINATKEMQVSALNSLANMGELASVNHGTYSMSNVMTDAVADHVKDDKNTGDNIWARYIHNKEDINGISLGGMKADYDATFNGIIVGSDFAKTEKSTTGVSFAYAEGDIKGNTLASRTENDADYYGLSVYHQIKNNDGSSVLGDISYMHSSNDVTQYNSGETITASPDADAFSIGVRAQKDVKVGKGTLSPYAGIRYMHLGTGDYINSLGMNYDVEEQNLWLLPVGVSYSTEIKYNDWTVKPMAEVGYMWTMGDRQTDQTVSLYGTADSFGFDVADSSSFFGKLGITAESDKMAYGIAYQYQKGDTVDANQWIANVEFKF